MAMGGQGRRMAENAIASCRPFRNSTGSFYGTRGPTRTLGWLEQHTDARRIQELLSQAVYVVWSYGTPISFVSEAEDGERTAYYVDESHSATTANHQGIAQMGMGEYETIGGRRPARRPRRVPVDQGAVDRAIGVVRGYAEARDREPTAAHAYAAGANARPVQETAQSSVRPVYTPVTPDTSGPDFLAPDQDTQRRRLADLLDPRYADPDWTPWQDEFTGNLPEGAEGRDAARIAREGRWHL